MARPRVVIVGVSTRAAVEAAHASGFDCLAADAFGDLDQRRWATTLGVQRDLGRAYSATGVVAAAARFEAENAAYVGNLENHPAAVQRLARGRTLLGNRAETLDRVRDPRALALVVRQGGGRTPRTLFAGPVPSRGRWLRKPVRGGGGQGVRDVPAGSRIPAGFVAQARIDGVAASVSFLADGRRALVLGFARGLAGDPAFGGRGYRYCGNLFPFPVPPAAATRLEAVAQVATRSFGLVGLNGIDFVLRDDEPVVLEINPRFSASMELLQRAGLHDLFALHVDACGGRLPERLPALASGSWGKAVVWAESALEMPDTRDWLSRDDARDVPFPADHIERGAPICTVLAHAADAPACHAALAARARWIHSAIAVADGAPA